MRLLLYAGRRRFDNGVFQKLSTRFELLETITSLLFQC